MGIFKVIGNAKRTVNNDVALISVTFIASAKTSFAASAKVMQDCESFLEELKKAGAEPGQFTMEEDKVTEAIYRDDHTVNATRKISVRIPYNMEAVNAIRSLIDAKKYDADFDLSFELSNENEIRAELLKEAILNSKAKAESLAEALGMEIKGIESVKVCGGETVDYPEQFMACERGICMSASGYSHSNDLKAKERELTESVEAKWVIE